MIDNASIVPLVHPIQMFAVSPRLSGPAAEPNSTARLPWRGSTLGSLPT